MKCQKCGQEAFLPFKCPYCGGYFCSEHRLPENHECPRRELARVPREEAQAKAVQRQKSYDYTVSYAPLGTVRKNIYFSDKEIRHLAIAALLVMGIGLSAGMFPNIYAEIGGPYMLTLFAAILTGSFFIHEIAHKIAAQKKGLWAEFRLTFMGAILTLISIISPLFKIISPGAVMVAGFVDRESMGKISIAGPATNITLSAIFLMTVVLIPQYDLMFSLGAAFNAWIAIFNLIPFGILDGFKVFLWNKKIWVLAFTASLALTIISYRFIY
ncbi:MAG: hypothetical protein OEY22_07635 [Candidatus Bathyarchaeota archaeon]|nr:hypothetical protein [Candidatus Bathyarchaeota archaeon]MDH5788358.1 hypothetical protein [Candidatus Bathyarchaeota archaeon]